MRIKNIVNRARKIENTEHFQITQRFISSGNSESSIILSQRKGLEEMNSWL